MQPSGIYNNEWKSILSMNQDSDSGEWDTDLKIGVTLVLFLYNQKGVKSEMRFYAFLCLRLDKRLKRDDKQCKKCYNIM